MIVNYCLRNQKNITVSRLITYIFLCVMNIMVMLSVVEAINIPYNKYMFNLGVGSNYVYKTNVSRYDMAFVNNISLGSGYSEGMTKPKSPLYCRRALETNVYLCEDFNCLQKSYFADNILSYDQTLLENNNDVIPIFISYDLMYELEVSEGDFLILYQYRTIYAKLQICGVLRPSYKEFIRDTEAVVIADRLFIEELDQCLQNEKINFDSKVEYLNFTDTKENGKELIYSKTDENLRIKDYLKGGQFFTGKMTLLFGSIIVVLAACVESGYVLQRNRQSLGIMRRLGLSRWKISFAAVLIVLTEFIITMPFTLAFVVFWLRYVLFIYMDISILLLICLIILILIVISSVITVMIRSRRDEFYTV